jgi:lycopene cyclase domain-containing protein
MTYFRFHLIFNLPVLVVLLLLNSRYHWWGGELAALGFVLIAVMVFTTPWDNLAAKWGIWGFPREKYSLRIGYLPVEEYAFFILQSVNVIMLIRALLHYFPAFKSWDVTIIDEWTHLCLVGSILPWAVIAWQLYLWRKKKGPCVNYAIHLAWFLPVIYFQWVVAPPLFWHHAGMLAMVTAIFGIYYTVADIIAVKAGIWFFDEKQITGYKFRGILPWEEIAFFFLTSLLVAQSFLLLLPSEMR